MLKLFHVIIDYRHKRQNKKYKMSETTKGGLAPQFNLAESISNPALPVHHDDILPIAVEAASRLSDRINIDPKTNLLNESSWRDQLTSTIESLEPEDSLRVYVTDLDGFKAVNDLLGHKDGDELLNIVGEAFKSSFQRETDIAGHGSREKTSSDSIARLGGDEFAVFSINKASEKRQVRTSDSDTEAKIQMAKVNTALSQLLSGTKFEKLNVKISSGSAQREPGESAESVFARADLKMFEAKYASKTESTRNAVSKMSAEDIVQIKKVIAFLESQGQRIQSYLIEGIKLAEAA
ncbi:MAG TPA: GGDEF domain-containing protein [Patescibacteria group bacterium]|nr:GGDEF domain-containing protein [Patescibacteria group bacterium]